VSARLARVALCLLVALTAAAIGAPLAFARGLVDLSTRGDLLEAIKARGILRCGVRAADFPGFTVRQPDGSRVGFDADFCRAMAAAILADDGRVEFVGLPFEARFSAVREGVVDLYVGGITQTLSREGALEDGGEGVAFAPATFIDGQTFVASAAITTDPGADLATVLNGRTVCIREGTTNVTNLNDFALAHGITYVAFFSGGPGSSSDVFIDFDQGRCDVVTSDRSALLSRQTGFARPSTLLNTNISREPLAPVLGTGTSRTRFDTVVRWVVYATFAAEELGIDSGNVGAVPPSGEGRRLLGYTPGLGARLGLADDWALQVIARVGNYRQIYERNLPGVPRGLNALPAAGGLLFAPPFQ
jgi:general L-amino acid transport system substrate-binding protein